MKVENDVSKHLQGMEFANLGRLLKRLAAFEPEFITTQSEEQLGRTICCMWALSREDTATRRTLMAHANPSTRSMPVSPQHGPTVMPSSVRDFVNSGS